MIIFVCIVLFNSACMAFELDDQELRAQAQELVEAWHQPYDKPQENTSDRIKISENDCPYYEPYMLNASYLAKPGIACRITVSDEVFCQAQCTKRINCIHCSDVCDWISSNTQGIKFFCNTCNIFFILSYT